MFSIDTVVVVQLPDARAFGDARVITRADFGGLTSNARVIVLANGITTATSGKTHQVTTKVAVYVSFV